MSPLDQYIIANPRWIISRTPEHARLNPDNEVILAGHLACAAAEIPIRGREDYAPGAGAETILDDLVEAGQLYRSGDRYFWAGEGSPGASLSLRQAGADRVVIQYSGPGGAPRIVGEVDRASVRLLAYEGAIYLHEGETYQVDRLDLAAGVAHVRPVDVDFYTSPGADTEVTIVQTHAVTGEAPKAPAQAGAATPAPALYGWGDARVTSKANGYKVIRRGTNEVLGFGEIDLPPETLETQACWLSFPEHTVEALKAVGAWLSDPNEYGPNWAATRRAVRERDGFRCQGCGAAEQPGKQHDVHHKVPFRAFVAEARLREGLPVSDAWQVANRLPNLVTLCPTCHRRAEAGIRTRSGLGGAAALIAGVAPLFLMCDPGDLGIVAEPQDAVSGSPTITVYEQMQGGIGYAEQLYLSMREVLSAAEQLAAACPCERGCPACVGPVLEHEYTLDTKMLARELLHAALGEPISG